MNFGIPFRKPLGAPFGVPFLGGVTSGIPSLPTANNVGYYSADDINTLGFSSANNLNWWQDEGIDGSSNDLTQGTASANMTFIEHDTVTQFSVLNRPTLKYDKEVSQDTSADQPTLVDVGGGELAVDFPEASNTHMTGFSLSSSDWLIEWESTFRASTDERFISSSTTKARFDYYGDISVRNDVDGFNTFVGLPNLVGVRSNIKVWLKDNTLELFIDDVSYGSYDVTGQSFLTIDSIGHARSFNVSPNCQLFACRVYNKTVVDPLNITETPDDELLPDPTTMRKDDGTQPVAGDQIQGWYATGAELAMGFGGNDYLELNKTYGGIDTSTDISMLAGTNQHFFLSSSSTSCQFLLSEALTSITIWSDSGTQFNLVETIPENARLTFTFTSTELHAYIDGVEMTASPVNITGHTFTFDRLGRNSSSFGNDGFCYSLGLYDEIISNPTNITETPTLELLPTEESCNVLAGNLVSRWNSTTHKPWLNYVENTVTQFLEGLSPQNGSFTYVLRANLTDPVTAGAMISSSIDSSGLFNVDADTLDFRDGAGTNNNFDFDNFDDVSAYAFTFDGTTLTGYKNSCVSFTLPIDATGQAFNLTDLGASTAGATMRIYEMGNYSSDLAKTDLDYFSYIKDINTNQFVLPLQLPACPIAPLIYPLSAFNAKNNNETAYTTDLPVSMATLKAQGFSMSCFVDTLSVAGNQRLFGIRNDPSDVSLVSDITVVMLGATQTDVQGYNGIGNTIMASIGTVKGEGLTHVGITYDGTDNTGTLRSYINGVETRNQVFTNWSATANSALLYWCGANNAGYTAENPNGMFAMPRLQDRAITAAEMLYLVQNPSICYDDIDNTAGLKDATIYAPTFGEYNGSTNQALVDPASGTTTVVNEPVDYDGTGLSVKCTT